MVDRATLIQALEPLLTPTGTQAESIRKALDKALSEAVLALSLTAARGLPETTRRDLELVLRSLDSKQAEKVAGLWDAKRKLDVEMKRSVKEDLVDLLYERRAPYEPIKFDLEEARAVADSCRSTIQRVAPAKDLKLLLARWDKNLKPKPSERSAIVARLLSLLSGAEPSPPPTRRR